MQHVVFRPAPGVGLLYIMSFSLGILAGCSSQDDKQLSQQDLVSGDSISVLVTVEPIAWLVEQVGSDRVKVDVLVPAGQEPETFSPSPRQAASFASKEIFFRVGLASEESFLPSLRTMAPRMKTIDLREGLPVLKDVCSHKSSENENTTVLHDHNASGTASTSGEHDHSHAHEHNHNHEHNRSHVHKHECGTDGIDPHFWMSPEMTGHLVKRIARELSQKNRSSESFFLENANRLCGELEALQKRIRTSLERLKTRTIFVYHPAYGYFCREFGLEQCAIEVGGRSPKPRDMAAFVTRFKASGANSIIIQPEFGEETAKSLVQTMRTQVVFHSPLEKNYFKNLEQLVGLITQMEATNPKTDDKQNVSSEPER